MNRDICERIAIYCDRNRLFADGDGVVAGLSGGADSVFLLWFLAKQQERWGLRIQAVHVNHGIRGEEALRDQEYAALFAERNGIPCRVERADIPSLAKEWRMTEEEAGRIFRYQCFERVREELGFDKIAVAHHRDDQAETVLFQLLRGSGLRGLGGMRPKRGRIVRPLLETGRREIEEALEREGISYCTDTTNEQGQYARNIIRNQVMPLLKEKIQPMAAEHIAGAGTHLQEIMDYIDCQRDQVYTEIVRRDRGRLVIDAGMFEEVPAVIGREVILKMMQELSGGRKDITAVHVESVESVFRGQTGKKVMLPYGMAAEKSYEYLLLYQKGTGIRQKEGRYSQPQTIQLGSAYKVPWRGRGCCDIVFYKKTVENLLELNLKKHCTKCFDYAKMDSMPVLRYPEEGDFLWLDRAGRAKKLSRLFIDEKVSRGERKDMVVLAEGHHVIWIPVLGRCSAYYYVTGDTRAIIQADLGKIRFCLS